MPSVVVTRPPRRSSTTFGIATVVALKMRPPHIVAMAMTMKTCTRTFRGNACDADRDRADARYDERRAPVDPVGERTGNQRRGRDAEVSPDAVDAEHLTHF